MDLNLTTPKIREDYEIQFWNHDAGIFAFKTVFGHIHSVPFLLKWKQPKPFKDFLLEILTDFDSDIADESESYIMTVDLTGAGTAVGDMAPMNIIVFYKEINNAYTCFYGSSVSNAYQSFTLPKVQMADFVKNILKAINDKGIKREILL